MSRINTNIQSLVAQRVLGQNNQALGTSLDRLSTGLRINRGKDDPAGLIASENLRAEIRASNAAISNAQRADQVVNIAEGGLQEVSGLLTELQGLLTQSASSAGLSQEEKSANQLQIDSVLQSIDRIANGTSFQGIKLLNGNFDYQAQNVSAAVSDFRINASKFNGANLDVEIVVTQSAQQGQVYLSVGGTSLNFGDAAQGSFTIEISGNKGNRELSFASGTTLNTIVNTINSFTDVTGVTASVAASGSFSTGLSLISEDFGSDEFVSVKVINDAGINGAASQFGVYGFDANDATTVLTTGATQFDSTAGRNGVRDAGQNIAATVNGIEATARGKTLRINTDFLDVETTLTTADSQNLATLNAFSISGGGADFQLAGNVDIGGKVSLGISNIATRNLGSTDVGFLDDLASGKAFNIVDGNIDDAQKIITKAISQISSTRGRLGAFQTNVVGATIRSLGVSVENTSAAESLIRDTDFAQETAKLTRSQILSQASTQILSLANSTPQNALALLG